MKIALIRYLICGLLPLSSCLAADSVSAKILSVVPAIVSDVNPEGKGWLLTLNVRYVLESTPYGTLQIGLDQKEENSFETIQEQRVERGNALLELKIPISDWNRDKLNAIVVLRKKSQKADLAPLATRTIILDKVKLFPPKP